MFNTNLGETHCLSSESEASATNLFCAKAKRQLQIFFARQRQLRQCEIDGKHAVLMLTYTFSNREEREKFD
ncbi:hypothetical protein FJQ98_13840 [Lysinibacillus agricola]|uniref:Uncharacterized protein n=1 Tax=Lysinibacillus agricola TaxID=2590012 RepID=A0ABX7AKN8_9BACI|nr:MULTISPECIES: hypothetical protein [Lysinibacillus]QQP10373.1 hypothetical protein FJQ98_13840 [Lysinibacillus agricola]